MSIGNLIKPKPLNTFSKDKHGILDQFIWFVDSEDAPIYYIKPEFNSHESLKSDPKPYDTKGEDDFQGDYLGEVELRLNKTSLKDGEIIHYEDEDDLFRRVVQFIWKSTNNYVAIGHGPLISEVDCAADNIYCKFQRGGITKLFCTQDFYNRQTSMGDARSCGFEGTIIVDCLPNNLAVSVYKSENEADLPLVAYWNKKEKYIKLKMVVDYSAVLYEED